jgi:hypothetical protein
MVIGNLTDETNLEERLLLLCAEAPGDAALESRASCRACGRLLLHPVEPV